MGKTPYQTSIHAAIEGSGRAYFTWLSATVSGIRGVVFTTEDNPEEDLRRIREQNVYNDNTNMELVPFVVCSQKGLTRYPIRHAPNSAKFSAISSTGRGFKYRNVKFDLSIRTYVTNYAQALQIVEAITVEFLTEQKFQYENPYFSGIEGESSEFSGVMTFGDPEIFKVYRLKEKDLLYRVGQTVSVSAVLTRPLTESSLPLITEVDVNFWDTRPDNFIEGIKVTEDGYTVVNEPVLPPTGDN